MHVPATQRTRDELDQNDAFLRACLGLVCGLPAFDRVLECVGPATRAAPNDATTLALRDAVLGAVSLRLQLGAYLNHLAASQPQRADSPLSPDAEPIQELLR